ncbi:MAG: hypothetical protein AAGJ46_10170 [Planctomycetota bacterium]
MQVDAYDSGGAVSNVQLFLKDTLVRQENFEPWTWNAAGIGQSDALLSGLPTGDYTLRAVATDNSGLQTTVERVISVALLGDFNRDGSVDTADFTVWRDTLGQAVTPFAAADADGSGVIGVEDYALWRANYGQAVGATTLVRSIAPQASRGVTIEAPPAVTAASSVDPDTSDAPIDRPMATATVSIRCCCSKRLTPCWARTRTESTRRQSRTRPTKIDQR